MKKVVKIMAGLLLGIVIVAGVKTEAKAGTSGMSLETIYYLTAALQNGGGSSYVVGYNADATSKYAYDLQKAYESIYTAMYMQKQAEQYYNIVQTMAYYVNWIQPYVVLTNGTNPFYQDYVYAAEQYNALVNSYYKNYYYGY